MPLSGLRLLILIAFVAGVMLTPGRPVPGAATSAQQPKDKVDPDHVAKIIKGTELFKTSVRGILQSKCVKCHSGERVEGEFDMGTREAMLTGGVRGPAVVPGDHKKSLLYQLAAHDKQPHMPYERPKLKDEELAKIAEWIDLGAPFDKPFVEIDETAWTRKVVSAEAKKHWAYQPLAKVHPPKPGIHPIDAFLLDRLEKAGSRRMVLRTNGFSSAARISD